VPGCCCVTCQERLRLAAERDSRAAQLEACCSAMGSDPADDRRRQECFNAAGRFLDASRALSQFELQNMSTLWDHLLVGATVGPFGLVTREPLMPDTDYYHDWVTLPPEGFEHVRRCRNCGITYVKKGGDPHSSNGWQKETLPS
jgi:hypothetical protein